MSDFDAPVRAALSRSGGLAQNLADHRPLGVRLFKKRWIIPALLAVGDVVSGAIGLGLAAVAAAQISPDAVGVAALSKGALKSLLLLMAIYVVAGLYRPGVISLLERFRLRVFAILAFVFVQALLSLRAELSADVVMAPLAGLFVLVLGCWAEQLIGRSLMRRKAWGLSAIVYGDPERSARLARLLMAYPDWGLTPVGIVDSRGEEAGSGPSGRPNEPLPVSLFGTLESCPADRTADVLIVTSSSASHFDCHEARRLGFRQILFMCDVGDIPTFGLRARHFDQTVGLELGTGPTNPREGLKRFIDLAATLPALLLAAPLVLAAAAAIRVVDPGPAFYGQWRVGRGGKLIRILKLRTMYQDAEQRLTTLLASDPDAKREWERYFKLSSDPRILPTIGTFLRRTSLDELPQLWNVLRGDISLVGPRPFPDYHLKAFDADFQSLRSSVPPGLTGLWQISSRSEGDLQIQQAQDSFYIRNRSLWLDLYILLATLPAIVIAQGAK